MIKHCLCFDVQFRKVSILLNLLVVIAAIRGTFKKTSTLKSLAGRCETSTLKSLGGR